MSRKALRITALILVLLCVFETKVQARSPKDFLITLEGVCLRNMHDVGIVEEVVKTMDGKELSDGKKHALAPQEGKLLGAWSMNSKGYSLIVVISEAQVRDVTVSSCTIVTQAPNVQTIVKKMKEKFNFRPILDEDEGYQRHRHYKANFAGENLIITAGSGTHPSTSNILNISVQNMPPYKN